NSKNQNTSKSRNSAYASIGFGRISFNTGACELIENFPSYNYAKILKAKKDGKLLIGVKLYTEYDENSIKISKRKLNGKIVDKSFNIENKPLMEELFGIQGTQNKVTRYSVKLDPEDKTILIIYGE
ncbi:MAG: hypothetical protein IJR61_07985, partial [Clostridia bacterium]|nr:hypothetical protein [Clostridia bacterium]